MNLKTEHENRVYVTEEMNYFTYEINEFPPKNLQISPKKPIKLVDETDSSIIVYIEAFDSKMTYPTDNKIYDVRIVKEVFEFEFTYEILHKHGKQAGELT